jgi:hypothetical protein
LIRRFPAGALLFCVLCAAVAATAVAVLHFKTGNLALEVQHLDCRVDPGSKAHPVAHISFYTRYSDPHAEVSLVGEGLSPARVLDSDLPIQANVPVHLTWNGMTDAGTKAPRGRYALEVNLPSRGRDMLWITQRIHVGQPCTRPKPGG